MESFSWDKRQWPIRETFTKRPFLSTHNTMRRRGRSPTSYTGTNTESSDQTEEPEYMDSNDQDDLVETLEIEAIRQNKQFQGYFTAVGGFAVFISLIYPLLCEEECSADWNIVCWMHTLVAAVSHAVSMSLSRVSPATRLSRAPSDFPLMIGIVVANSVLLGLLWTGKLGQDREHFHLGLLFGNLVTFLASMLLRWDARSTRRALDDLNGSKYDHKAL